MFNFRKTKLDEIEEKEKIAREIEQKKIEDLKIACASVFASGNGKYVLKYLKDFCGWNSQDMNINNEVLIYNKGRRDVWVLLRNVLPKKIVAEVEIYND